MEADAKLSADLDSNPVAPTLSAAADAEDGGDDIVSQLERLASLRDAGHLTQGQFDMAKEAVLRGSSAVAESGERATAIATATATAATGSASTSVSATASSADMITAAPSAGQSLSAAAQELQSLLNGRSAAARERCDAYHAAVRYSPDEDVLLFVSEAMAWRKKVLRAENSKQIIAADPTHEDEISPQDVLAESVTAGELFEEYLSREASDRILADGGGAVVPVQVSVHALIGRFATAVEAAVATTCRAQRSMQLSRAPSSSSRVAILVYFEASVLFY